MSNAQNNNQLQAMMARLAKLEAENAKLTAEKAAIEAAKAEAEHPYPIRVSPLGAATISGKEFGRYGKYFYKDELLVLQAQLPRLIAFSTNNPKVLTKAQRYEQFPNAKDA